MCYFFFTQFNSMSVTTCAIAPGPAQILPGCILPNPDIAGIGVRVAIYVQSFMAPVLAIDALLDGKVEEKELDLLERMSMSVLLTACALLASAFVQASTVGMSPYHALIILNLSWMNNTNTYVYAILFCHNGLAPPTIDDTASTADDDDVLTLPAPRKAAPLVIGSLHLSVVSAFGLWFWATVDTFGAAAQGIPPPPTFYNILGHDIPTTSKALRGVSLWLYAERAIPIFGLIFNLAFFCLFTSLFGAISASCFVVPAYVWIFWLVGLNIIMVIDTEIMIKRMAVYVQPGESEWTFGQTLALFLLALPLREVIVSRRERAIGGSRSGSAPLARIDSFGDFFRYILQALNYIIPVFGPVGRYRTYDRSIESGRSA